MEELIIHIGNYIRALAIDIANISPDAKAKNWGFVELVNRESKGKKKTSTQPIPVTINGTGDREQVSLDDEYDFMNWIRWTSPAPRIPVPEDTWGLSSGRRRRTTLRIVIAHKVELGEDLVSEIAQSLPDNFYFSGFDFVFTQGYSIDPDHETIYKTELGDTVYEQHRFDWNIYTIDLDVEFSKCATTREVDYG